MLIRKYIPGLQFHTSWTEAKLMLKKNNLILIKKKYINSQNSKMRLSLSCSFEKLQHTFYLFSKYKFPSFSLYRLEYFVFLPDLLQDSDLFDFYDSFLTYIQTYWKVVFILRVLKIILSLYFWVYSLMEFKQGKKLLI